MKIAKLKADKLEQIPADLAGKTFVRACSKIGVLHNNPAAPTGYLIVPNQSFKGETAPLFILGDLTGAWVKYAKSLKASTPTNVLYGQCFAQVDANGAVTIHLLNKAGKAKLNPFKQLFKTTLNKAKVTVTWANGLSDDSEETKIPETAMFGDKPEVADDQNEDKIEAFVGGIQANEAIMDLAEDAAHIKHKMEEMAKANGELKQQIFNELQVLAAQFIKEVSAIADPLPAPLAKFYNHLKELSQRWAKQALRQMIRKSGMNIIEKFKQLKALKNG